MEQQHTNMGRTTSAGKLGQMVIESVLKNFGGGTFFNQTPEDIYVECEVHDVSPCEQCQEFDCYGCEYKGGDAID